VSIGNGLVKIGIGSGTMTSLNNSDPLVVGFCKRIRLSSYITSPFSKYILSKYHDELPRVSQISPLIG